MSVERSITQTKDFKDSIQCIDCAYEDLGYNGQMLCMPRMKGCRAVYPYDLALGSRIRKADMMKPKGSAKDDGGYTGNTGRSAGIKISREG